MLFRVGERSIALDKYDHDAEFSFVSHAHSDHTQGLRKSSTALMSEQTAGLLAARGKNVCTMVPPKSTAMINAGHILGSKQLYMEFDELGTDAIYSGDYQMQQSFAAERIEIKRAETLIIDSTYPYPNIEFDDRDDVAYAMQRYVRNKTSSGAAVVFGTYTMGKAQEIVRIMNDIGIVPTVDPKVARINEVYGEFGIHMRYSTVGDESQENGDSDPVLIMSNSGLTACAMKVSEERKVRVYTAMASGFAKIYRFNTDVQFPLSDHADFKQAVEYVGCCQPKQIFTVGGNSETMAKNLRAEGYRASVLESGSTISLASHIKAASE